MHEVRSDIKLYKIISFTSYFTSPYKRGVRVTHQMALVDQRVAMTMDLQALSFAWHWWVSLNSFCFSYTVQRGVWVTHKMALLAIIYAWPWQWTCEFFHLHDIGGSLLAHSLESLLGGRSVFVVKLAPCLLSKKVKWIKSLVIDILDCLCSDFLDSLLIVNEPSIVCLPK